jgi:hypothetical protein
MGYSVPVVVLFTVLLDAELPAASFAFTEKYKLLLLLIQ